MAKLLANLNIFKAHRSWEDLFSAALGLLLLVSPVLVQGDMPPPVMFSVLMAGIVILAVSLFEVMMAGRWEEIIQFVLGLWLVVSVFVLDYGAAGQLRVWHFVIGALAAVMAAFEFWQDSLKKS
jgi:SPW repeat